MEAIQEMERTPVQLSGLARDVWEWGGRLFDDIISILAAIAAHDNRWDS